MNLQASSVINSSLRARRATARALNKLMDEVQVKREEKGDTNGALRSMISEAQRITSVTSDLLLIITHTLLRLFVDIPTPWFSLITARNGGRSANKEH